MDGPDHSDVNRSVWDTWISLFSVCETLLRESIVPVYSVDVVGSQFVCTYFDLVFKYI